MSIEYVMDEDGSNDDINKTKGINVKNTIRRQNQESFGLSINFY